MSYLPLLGRFVGIRGSFRENEGRLGVEGGDVSQGGTSGFLRFVREAFLSRSTKEGFRCSSFDCRSEHLQSLQDPVEGTQVLTGGTEPRPFAAESNQL